MSDQDKREMEWKYTKQLCDSFEHVMQMNEKLLKMRYLIENHPGQELDGVMLDMTENGFFERFVDTMQHFVLLRKFLNNFADCAQIVSTHWESLAK